MVFRNRLWWVWVVGIVLLWALEPQPIQAVGKDARVAQTDPVYPQAQEDVLAPYTIQPVFNAAQQDRGHQYQAINPSQAFQLFFRAEQLAVAPLQTGQQPWQLLLGVEQASLLAERAQAANGTQAIAVAVAANRLQYQRANLSEWFHNEEDGVRHGLVVQQRPADQAADQPLQLRLRLGGTLHPRISSDQQAVDFVTDGGAVLLRYANLSAVDAHQRTLAAFFSQTETGIALNIDDRLATYPLTMTPVLTSYLVKQTMPDGAPADFLGYDVNVSGDTVIVGADGDDTARGVDAGSAFIYLRNLGGANRWRPVIKLEATDGAAGDEFGRDTYVTSGTTVIVGAPGHDANGENAGAAYIFGRDQGGLNAWGQEGKLTAADGKTNQRFGSVVSVQLNTAVVGVPNDSRNGENAGAVYIFERVAVDPVQWRQVKVLTPADSASGDNFGAVAVISNDNLYVSAPKDDDACGGNSTCDAGAVYIFDRNLGGANNWGLLKKVTASDGAAGDAFGFALSYSDDRLIVGAPLADTNGADAGAVYVFNRDFGGVSNWGQRKKVVATDGAAGEQFGYSVGIGGSGAIVGAPFDQENGPESGAAYILYRNANGNNEWGEMTKLVATDGAGGDRFGWSVDHRSGNAVVGAYRHDAKGSDAGAIYLYRFPFTIGSLQIVNRVQPTDPNASWQVTVQGLGTLTDTLTGDSQTDPVNLFAGNYRVTARVSGNTNANNYSTTWQCLVNDEPGPAGNGITFPLTLNTADRVVCTFTHTPPTATGAVVIANATTPAGGTGFAFTDTIAPPNRFTLNDGGQQRFADLAPGAYQVTSVATAGWLLSGLTCLDPDNGTTTSGATAAIDLDAGETVFCTFASRQAAPQVGTIVVNVQSTPLGVGFPFTQTITAPTAFLLDAGSSKTFADLPADSYEVTAAPLAGWHVVSVSCSDADNGSTSSGSVASIDLDAGETVTCTFSYGQGSEQNRTQLFLPLVLR